MAKKSKAKKKSAAVESREPKFDLGLAQETKNSIWGILSFGLAIVSTLAFFHRAGVAGEYFYGFAHSLFGWGIFLIPTALVLVGIGFLRSVSQKIYVSVFLGIVIFVLSFLGIFYIIGDSSDRISHGGYLGLILGYPLQRSLGFLASFIIFIFLIFSSVLVVLNIPVHSLIPKRAPVDEDEEEESEEDEESSHKQEAAVVIKRGNEIVDIEKEKAAEALKKKAPVLAKKHEDDEERDFMIKARAGSWVLPPLEILSADKERPNAGDINTSASVIKRTLSNFSIDVEMGEVSIGPTVTQFTLRPAVGVKLSRITALKPDLSLALAAHPLRIEAPIPGKSLVGVEVPNKKTATVGLRDLIDHDQFQKSNYFLPVALGRDVAGFPVFIGIEKMPHLLIAGATGSGKSVGINTLLLSLLYKHSPNNLKLILVDPKRVELTPYNDIPHLITPVITESKKVVNALKWAVREMDKRYDKLSQVKSRDIFSYNTQQAAKKQDLMPFIVIVIDELADIMAAYGRDVEAAIVRLAQMSRAVGIHLVLSTQRPSVEVITGLIKANITSRVAFQVASQIDSRTILDSSGAENLLGHGDLLYQAGDTSKPRRVQGAFVSEKEVRDVVKFIKQQADELDAQNADSGDNLKMELDQAVAGAAGFDDGDDDDAGDDLYEEAKALVIESGKASASLLQRRLRVGYARAARLLDILEDKGIIGPGEGAKPREVYAERGGGSSSIDEIADFDPSDSGVTLTSAESDELNQAFDERQQDRMATED